MKLDNIHLDISEAAVSEAAAGIIEVGRRLYAAGMAAGNSGNISVRLGANAVLITPTGVCKGDLQAADLLLVDLAGKVLAGSNLRKPTSEAGMHLAVYRANAAAGAVIHAHSPYACAFALAGKTLADYRLAEITERLGDIPLLPYAPPGSNQLADQVGAVAAIHTGALLAEHGPVVWAGDLREARYNMEELEGACRTVTLAALLRS